MARVLWLNWSGGGNLPPSLGIARELERRGHRVAFAGRPEMVGRVERAGFRALELKRAYEQVGQYPEKWLPRAASFLTSPAVEEEIRECLKREQPDVVAIDAMFPAALVAAAEEGKRPTAVFCHTSVVRMEEGWRKTLAMITGLRSEAGFKPLPADPDTLWMGHDRLVVTTVKELDQGSSTLSHPDRIRYVGPVLEQERHAVSVELPWGANGAIPLVLVSFSTAPEQGSVPKFQAAIDALARLPVHGVVTVGDSIDPSALRPAGNVAVFATADHDQLMRRATAVLTHGGHGTLMRALSHGLPLVVVPGMASDQPVNAAAVQNWGTGLALPRDATADAMAAALRDIIANPSYRTAAQSIAGHFQGVEGAAGAAQEIEQLLS